eukprot:TRINITY_DN5057_c0_g1_i6.p1 TRINITY_DN5057_c0_g1~~TRINITY_DN5057_c0_g1_i6.p1  ORF type:complete len:374 (-),score=57.55 TRINITY_DN5057_c0_g1_i6:207-1328(-)
MGDRGILAFLVSAKNVAKVVHYINGDLEQLSRFQVLITKTEDKELDLLVSNNEWISLLPSLREGASTEIVKRCYKGKIVAVIVHDISSLIHPKYFSYEKLDELIATCWTNNTHICFDLSTTRLVIKHLSMEVRNDEEVSQEIQNVLLNQLPTFDQKIGEEEKARRTQVNSWNSKQFLFWLEMNSNDFLPLSDLQYLFSGNSKTSVTELDFGRYWARNTAINNFVRLVASPLDVGITLLTLGKDADLLRIWDCNTFRRDFLICHHLFISSSDLMKALRVQYKHPPPPQFQDEGDWSPGPTVISLLQDWMIMEFGMDFKNDPSLVAEFEQFIEEDISHDNPSIAKDFTQLLHMILKWDLLHFFTVEVNTSSLTPK